LIDYWTTDKDSPSWSGDFSLILGDGTIIPVNKILPDDGRASYLLPKGASLAGLLLQGVPVGKMPIVTTTGSAGWDVLLMDRQNTKSGEIKILLKEAWHGGFDKKFDIYTDKPVQNPALKRWIFEEGDTSRYAFSVSAW
jgi:hypothetical protein